jgi:hypothetical protein
MVDVPAAVGVLAAGQAFEVGRDDAGRQALAHRPAGERREVERADVLVLGAALDAEGATGGDRRGEALEERHGRGLVAGDRVEQLEAEQELERRGRPAGLGGGVEAETRRTREPRVTGDPASWRATACARPATAAVMWSDDTAGSAASHQGAVPADCDTGNANGRPPSGSETAASQSQSSTARGLVAGAASANVSNAWNAPPGWLSGARRSGSRPHPYPPSALR